MTRLRRGEIRFLVLEGLIVLFGVLTALLVDEWREERGLREEARSAIAALVAEVERNQAELQEVDSVVSLRLGRLRDLGPEMDGTVALGAVTGRFGGYRTPELSEGAWLRLSTGAVASHVPDDLVADAFALYALHPYFERLDAEVTRLVFSELNVDPQRARSGWLIAQGIMQQQLLWAQEVLPRYRDFLARWDGAP